VDLLAQEAKERPSMNETMYDINYVLSVGTCSEDKSSTFSAGYATGPAKVHVVFKLISNIPLLSLICNLGFLPTDL
jgi:hypothetical protein